MKASLWPKLGCGVGLRNKHYAQILSERPAMDWFEAVTENFLDTAGRPLRVLEQIRRHYPVGLHGVSLSIGTTDVLDMSYLAKLIKLVTRIEPAIVSDHLCWTGVEGENLHDLLPLPLTEEALKHVVERISRVQDALGRPLLLENISTYVTYRHSTVPEWEFLRETARRSGCGILLDLNNIFVNSVNHRFDPMKYLEAIPADKVGQFHLAGHTDKGEFLFDTHSAEVVEGVWNLYRRALELYGPVSTLIEWDEAIPDFGRLSEETEKAKRLYAQARVPKDASRHAPLAFPGPDAAAPSLREAQIRFKRFIRPGQARVAGSVLLNPQGSASGEERMAVYAEGYMARLSEALAEVYEAVRHVMGAEAFRELCRLYLDENPSRGYNLGHVGAAFPEFIARSRFARKLPFLPDLAGLERFAANAFHAEEESVFNPAALTSLSPEDWEKMRIRFQPSVAVLSSQWPVVDIWEAKHTPLSELAVELENRPQSAVVYRRGLDVVCERVEPAQAALMRSLLEGETLGASCSRLSEISPERELPAGDWFALWAGRGLITRVEGSGP